VTAPGFSPDALVSAWRALPVPLVGRVADDRALVDLRSIAPEEDAELCEALVSCVR
jgi:hypothetical protein